MERSIGLLVLVWAGRLKDICAANCSIEQRCMVLCIQYDQQTHATEICVLEPFNYEAVISHRLEVASIS